MTEPIDTGDIRRRLVSGEISNPIEVLLAALNEVNRVKTENADLRAIITSVWDGEWGLDVGPKMTTKQDALYDEIIAGFRTAYDV